MDNDVITFSRTSSDGKTVCLTFKIPANYTIYTLHRLCKRFAAVLGYMDKSIEETFGETVYDEYF